MTDLEIFNAAREAGMAPNVAIRYVWHVRFCEAEGRRPLDPAVAAVSATLARTAQGPVPAPDGPQDAREPQTEPLPDPGGRAMGAGQ